MSFRGVVVLKFVGTVSLGLLTGLSFTLSTVTVPTLLTLPSASSASRALQSLVGTAADQLRLLANVATSSLCLAYVLSPRSLRHPYLLYATVLVSAGRAATSSYLAPYLFVSPTPAPAPAPATSPSSAPASAPSSPARHSTAHMEASYEVLGSATSAGSAGSLAGSVSDAHSDSGEGAASDVDAAEATAAVSGTANGEEVRVAVEGFLQKQMVQTALSGLAFTVAVVGIWGDGAAGL